MKFVENDKLKVLLIHGGGGSGKSLFCHMFIKMLMDNNISNNIPIFINLPSLKEPITRVIEETLDN